MDCMSIGTSYDSMISKMLKHEIHKDLKGKEEDFIPVTRRNIEKLMRLVVEQAQKYTDSDGEVPDKFKVQTKLLVLNHRPDVENDSLHVISTIFYEKLGLCLTTIENREQKKNCLGSFLEVSSSKSDSDYGRKIFEFHVLENSVLRKKIQLHNPEKLDRIYDEIGEILTEALNDDCEKMLIFKGNKTEQLIPYSLFCAFVECEYEPSLLEDGRYQYENKDLTKLTIDTITCIMKGGELSEEVQEDISKLLEILNQCKTLEMDSLVDLFDCYINLWIVNNPISRKNFESYIQIVKAKNKDVSEDILFTFAIKCKICLDCIKMDPEMDIMMNKWMVNQLKSTSLSK